MVQTTDMRSGNIIRGLIQMALPLMCWQLYHDHNVSRVNIRAYPLTLRSVKEIMVVTIPASVGQFFTAFGFILMNKAII